MRYHVVVYKVPDTKSALQVPFVDEEFDSSTGQEFITDAVEGLIEGLRDGV